MQRQLESHRIIIQGARKRFLAGIGKIRNYIKTTNKISQSNIHVSTTLLFTLLNLLEVIIENVVWNRSRRWYQILLNGWCISPKNSYDIHYSISKSKKKKSILYTQKKLQYKRSDIKLHYKRRSLCLLLSTNLCLRISYRKSV